MDNKIILQLYLRQLYNAFDEFQADYKRLHNRSLMRNRETLLDYYIRWRDNMRREIRRVELLLVEQLKRAEPEPESETLIVDKNRLQYVGISENLAYHY